MKDPIFAFFGTSEFSIGVLNALKENGLLPALIITQPDRPKGRGQELAPPPVKEWAIENSIEFIQPETLTHGEELEILMNSEWDFFVTASYGLIIPRAILDIPQHGALNVHPSMLPKYRGASPIQTQILNDDRAVGVTIMLMDEKMDHGPLLAQGTVELDVWPEKAPVLEALLAKEGGNLLAEVIPEWVKKSFTADVQDDSKATFCRKFTKEDGLLDLSADPYQNYLKFCALYGWPGTYFFITKKDGTQMRVKVTDAKFAEGLSGQREFRVLSVIPEGKKEMAYDDFLRGISQ